jgi:hypothetical protein
LRESQVVLFLISPSFIASEFIRDIEIKSVIEQSKSQPDKVMIVPVKVRPCDFASLPLKFYQAATKNNQAISLSANRDEAGLEVVANLKSSSRKNSSFRKTLALTWSSNQPSQGTGKPEEGGSLFFPAISSGIRK